MSIKFYGVGGVGQIGNVRKSSTAKPADKTGSGQEKDQVQFSSVLKDVNQAKATDETTENARADRVQELKAQVQNGSYQPDLNKVASNLLQFLMEEK
ncbi:MAG: flagellar biosynthesis anti-sigma factor FlgM [Thermodesulfobacteriota bacterium]